MGLELAFGEQIRAMIWAFGAADFSPHGTRGTPPMKQGMAIE
jgi:DNA polymerase IIIc chi subunit